MIEIPNRQSQLPFGSGHRTLEKRRLTRQVKQDVPSRNGCDGCDVIEMYLPVFVANCCNFSQSSLKPTQKRLSRLLRKCQPARPPTSSSVLSSVISEACLPMHSQTTSNSDEQETTTNRAWRLRQTSKHHCNPQPCSILPAGPMHC